MSNEETYKINLLLPVFMLSEVRFNINRNILYLLHYHDWRLRENTNSENYFERGLISGKYKKICLDNYVHILAKQISVLFIPHVLKLTGVVK